MINRKQRPLIRNRYELFLEHKNAARQKANRFARQSSTMSSTSEKSAKTNLLDKTQLVEMTTMSSLPPQWIEQYEDCQEMLKEISQLKKEMSVLNQRRLNTIKESEQKQIDRQIYEKAAEATNKVKTCDKLLKAISQAEKPNPNDQRLCEHMCQALAIELQQKTRQMRVQQRTYVEQRKKLEGVSKVSFLQVAADKTLAEDYYEDLQQQQEDIVELQLAQRNNAILKIVQSIHDLHQIYKQLNNLVILQGSLLDRIDMNIDETVQHVSQGKQHLKKAHEHQKSPMACRCIIGLIVLILIMTVVLIVKYARK